VRHDIEGQFAFLQQIILSDVWRDIWEAMEGEFESFESLGIPTRASDEVVWTTCQAKQVVLVTGNRNADGLDSLEMVICRLGTPSSIPVMTIADPDRVLNDRGYARLVAERLLQYLLELEQLRGTGRIYIP
jgi:hypothetical protein